MDPSGSIRQAIALAKHGDKAQARRLVSGIVQSDPFNADAWVAMAQIVDNRSEAIECLNKALRINPKDEHARRYLEYLQKDDEQEERIPPFLIVAGVAALVVLCLVGFALSGRLLWPLGPSTAAEASDSITCRELIDEALKISNDSCRKIGRDEVCYGHTIVTASLKPGIIGRFTETGDVLSIGSMTRLSAAPLDLTTRSWGVGILKLEANLPYTLPGETVTMILAGDTSILDHTDTMEAFTFSTGIGGISCDRVPVDGLVVRTQNGAGIRFNVNGADLALSGDAVLQANRNGRMLISMINGGGWISSDGVARFFQQGETASVPLKGLTTDGRPSVSKTVFPDLCLLTGTCENVQTGDPASDAVAMLNGAIPESSITPLPTLTRTPLPTRTPRPRATRTPTPTSPVPSATPKPSATAKPTSAPAPAAAPTDKPAKTTQEPTEEPTDEPTEETETPEITKTDEPTEEPTEEQTPDVKPTCDKVRAEWRRVDGLTAQFSFFNDNPVTVYLSHVSIVWPGDNGALTNLGFNGQFNSSEVTLPVNPPNFDAAVSGSHAMLKPSTEKPFTDLQFKFGDVSAITSTGYTIKVQIDIGCTVSVIH